MDFSNRSHNLTNISLVNAEDDGSRRRVHRLWTDINLAALWTMASLIIILNTVVIITILRHRKRSRLYIFLLNMAIAGTGIIDCLIRAIESSLGRELMTTIWFGETISCALQRFLGNVTMSAANYILAATSLDRAMAVAKPMTHFRGTTAHRKHWLEILTIAICWAIGIGVSLHIVFVSGSYEIHGVQICIVDIPHKTNLNVIAVSVVAVPFAFIVVSYTVLVRAIHRRVSIHRTSNRRDDPMPWTMTFSRSLPNSKIRSLKLTFGIVMAFICSWGPFLVTLYLLFYHGVTSPAMPLLVNMYYLNSIANPVAFFIFQYKRRTETPQSTTLANETNLSNESEQAMNPHGKP